MRLLDYFFYRIYVICNLADDDPYDAAVFAALIISCLALINLISIEALLIKFGLFPSMEVDSYESVALLGILFCLVYFLFVRKKRFQDIEDIYKMESKTRKRIGALYFLLFLIFSFVFLFLTTRYRHHMYPFN